MIDVKIGDTYTTPGGVTVRAVRYDGQGCRNCCFYPASPDSGRVKMLCTPLLCSARIFIIADDVEDTKETITKPEETPAPSISLPTLSGMDDAFKRHVLSVARAEFVALFWDMPNTDLAAAMGVTEKTVRNIRKKRLRKNKESL